MRKEDVQQNYEPLPLPIDKPFEKLSKQEAKRYFDWFISHVDERSDYVRSNVAEFLDLSLNALDFSMESIIPVWKWFLQAAEIQPTPKLRLNQLRNALVARHKPEQFIDYIVEANNKELSLSAVFTYGCWDIKKHDELAFQIEKLPQHYAYSIIAQVCSQKNSMVCIGGLKIQLDLAIPPDINDGDFISFSVVRLDVIFT